MMRSIALAALAALTVLCAFNAAGQGIPTGVRGSVPLCTKTELHAGTCQSELPGYLATITDGNAADADRCASGFTAGGSEQVTCRYKSGDWEEFEPGEGGGGSADLGTTVEPTQVTVTNTAGSNAVLPAAGAGTAGVMTGAQESKLAGIEDNATADQTSAEILSAWETESGRDVSVDGSKLDSFYIVQDVGGDVGIDQTDIVAALNAACAVSGGQLLAECRPILLAEDATFSATLFVSSDGLAPSATTGEAAWTVEIHGLGSALTQTPRPPTAATPRCGTTINWEGPAGDPVIWTHAGRSVTFRDFCINAVGSSGAASHGLLFTAGTDTGEVSQGVRVESVDIFGFEDTWAGISSQVQTVGIALVPDDYSGDPPYASDVQIDNFVAKDVRIIAPRAFLGANGLTNGVRFENSTISYSDYGAWVEDSDLTIVGGYATTWPKSGNAGDEATLCNATRAALLIGSTSAEQPRSVQWNEPYPEIDCGSAVDTVAATDPGNTRFSNLTISGGAIAVGGNGQTFGIRYNHLGSISILGTLLGARNSEDFSDDFFVTLDPPDNGGSNVLRAFVITPTVGDWDTGVFRVFRNERVRPGIISDNIDPANLAGLLSISDMGGAINVPGQVNASGTASGTTFLRGDGVWAVPDPSPVDADGNGEFEVSYLWDADGDGSSWVTCTSKDTPDPACKVADERIYRDFADDLNCAIHGCGFGQMEHTGLLLLEPGAYVNFPCWDASEPAGFNDPTATDATLRDEPTDAAYLHCPAGENGLRRLQPSLAGWGGDVLGSGLSTRPTDTTALVARGFGRTDVSYIVDDRGNREDDWFVPSSQFHRTMGFGYPTSAGTVIQYGTASWLGQGGGGWGMIDPRGATEGILDLDDATICVCTIETGGCSTSAGDSSTGNKTFDIQSATTETRLLIEHDVSEASTRAASTIISPRSDGPYVQGTCDAGSVGVPLGLQTATMIGDEDVARGTLPTLLESIQTFGGHLYVLRDDYFSSAAQIRNVTFESQDWYSESGGDCADDRRYNQSVDSTDFDCDTNPMLSIHGFNGRTALKDVSIRYWGSYGIDGEITVTHSWPLLDTVMFQYGLGEPIADPGHGWRIQSVNVRDSVFNNFVVANFSNGLQFEDLTIQNSDFGTVMGISSQVHHKWSRVRIENSNFSSAFAITCGSEAIYLDDIFATGRRARGVGGPTQTFGMIGFECDDETNPIDNVVISRVRETPPGSSVALAGNYTNGGSSALVRVRISDTDEAQNIRRVVIRDSQIYNEAISDVGSGWTSRGGSCLVGIEDRTAAGGGGTDGLLGSDGTGGTGGELDTLRNFLLFGNSVSSNGQLFCEFAASGYWDDIAASCTDVNSIGGPPQTSGPPDGFCDSDGTTPVTFDTSDSALFDAHRTRARHNNFEGSL